MVVKRFFVLFLVLLIPTMLWSDLNERQMIVEELKEILKEWEISLATQKKGLEQLESELLQARTQLQRLNDEAKISKEALSELGKELIRLEEELKLAKEQKNALNSSFEIYRKNIQNEVQNIAKEMVKYERRNRILKIVCIAEVGIILGGLLYMIVR